MQQFEKLTLGSRIWTQFCWFLSRLYELEFTIYHSNNKAVGLNACLNRYWGQFEAIFLPRNFFSFGNFAFTGAWIFRLNSCCRLLNQNKPQRTSPGGTNFFLFLATVISNLFTQFKQTPNKREAKIYFERIIDSSAISENFNLPACKHASHEGRGGGRIAQS